MENMKYNIIEDKQFLRDMLGDKDFEKFSNKKFRRIPLVNGDDKIAIELDDINKLTPELAETLKENENISYVYIPTNRQDRMHYVNTPMIDNIYTKQDAIKCAEKMELLIGDLKNSNLSDLEKVMIVTKRINEGVVYDCEIYDRAKKGNVTPIERARVSNLTGALLEGKTVCAGYADVFKQAMNGLGIPARYVDGLHGNSKDFGGHAWNQVQIDGKWYNLDLTYIDGQKEKRTSEYDKIYSSKRFLLNDKDMWIIHGEPEKYKNKKEYLATYGRNDKGCYFPLTAAYGEKVEECTARSIEGNEIIKTEVTIKNKITEKISKSKNRFKEAISSLRNKWTTLTDRFKSIFTNEDNGLALPEPMTKLAEQPATKKVNKFREELKVSQEQPQQSLVKDENAMEKENSKDINVEDVLER